MPLINLRKYYYGLYKEDTFIEVSEEVAEGLLELYRYEDKIRCRMRRHNAYYTLELKEDFENRASNWKQPSPEDVLLEKEEEEHQALMLKRMQDSFTQLTPVQAKRIHARFVEKRIVKEIAEAEGITISSVHKTTNDGLRKLRKYFKKQNWTLRVR